MKVAWTSDTHLDLVRSKKEEKDTFFNALRTHDAVIISGDIAENTSSYLLELYRSIQKPIYFVLGNHDYYRSSFSATVASMSSLPSDVHYLPFGIVYLNNSTAVIGVDGWYDLKNGSFKDTVAILADFVYIKELKPCLSCTSRYFYDLDKSKLKKAIAEKVKQDKESLKSHLDVVLKNRNITNIIVVLHVPPFEQSAKYKGEPTSSDMLPYFSSKTYGRMLLSAAKRRPKVNFTVLCGHTHDTAYYSPIDNIQVYTAAAEYGHPEIAGILEIDSTVQITGVRYE